MPRKASSHRVRHDSTYAMRIAKRKRRYNATICQKCGQIISLRDKAHRCG